MGVAWFWARIELRRRWRSWVAVVLLIGIGGGLAMASLAAVRRTQIAYPRFLQRAVAPDLVVDPDLPVLGDVLFGDALAVSARPVDHLRAG